MGASDPDKTPVRGMPRLVDAELDLTDTENSGLRPRKAFDEALLTCTRAALELAQAAGDRVAIAIRGDPGRGIPMRIVEGIVANIETLNDGRERVRLTVNDGVEHVVLLSRIVRVAASPIG